MPYLFEHIINWYFSPKAKASPNTFITNRKQVIRNGAGTKGAVIGEIPANMLVVVDQEEWDKDQGWVRIFYIPYKKGSNVPAEWAGKIRMLFYPPDRRPVDGYIPEVWIDMLIKLSGTKDEAWQAWIDQSALKEWSEQPPLPPEPEPCPECPACTFETWLRAFIKSIFGK